MNKKIILGIIILITIKPLTGQSFFSFRVTGEYNFFSMSDLQDFQNEIVRDLQLNDVEAEVVESFPPHYGMQLQAVFPFKFLFDSGVNLGFLFGIASTGGRLHYRDYSGEIGLDQVVKIYTYGLTGEFEMAQNENFLFSAGLKIPLVSAYLENHYFFRVGDYSEDNKNKYKSFTAAIEPDLNLFYTNNNFLAGLTIGYMFSIPAEYKYKSDTDMVLKKNNGEPVNTGTTGFRIGLSIGYNLYYK
jgi:hypothetical protein